MKQSEKKSNHLRKVSTSLIIVLVLLIGVTIVGGGIITDWGNVRVTRLKVAGDDGVIYSCFAFIPKTATNDTPAPAVINNHGNTSNAVVMLSYAIEESRRGYVALVADIGGRGNSELSNRNFTNSIAIWETYLLNAPFVDGDHLNITGFSMSGTAAVQIATKNISHYDTVITLSSSGGPGIDATTPVNFLIVRGENDDLIRFDPQGVATELPDFIKANGIENFERNKLYGNFEDKSARMYYTVDGMMHIGASFYKDSVSTMVDFLQQSSPAPNYIEATNIVYLSANYIGLLGMFLIVGFILALVGFLTKTTFFAPAQKELPENVGLGKVGLSISVIVAAVLPTVTYVAVTSKQGIWFPVTTTFKFALPNGILSWLTILVLVSLVMGTLYHFTEGKKKGGNLENYGLTSSGSNILDWTIIVKNFLLALIVVSITIYWINTVNALIGFQYSFWTISFASVTAQRVIDAIPYMSPFFIVFLVSGFGMNIERRLRDSGNDKKDMLISVLFNMFLNSIGIIVIVIVNLVSAANSPVNHQAIGGALYSLLAWGMVFNMLYSALITVFCFRKTGTLWLGAFINAMFVPIMLCNGIPYGIAVGSSTPVVEGPTPSAGAATVPNPGLENLIPVVGGIVIVLFVAALIYFSIRKQAKEVEVTA